MNVYELMEEIISVVEGRKEGESTEDMKNRLHKELVLAVDKKAAKAREKGDHQEWEKQHKKLGKLDDIQPVYNAYVRAENDKIKEAYELMEEILNVVSEDIHSAIDKSNKGSEYTEKGTAKSDLHYLANRGQRMAEIQYAKEKGKPVGKQVFDEIEYAERQRGDDTKNAKGERKTHAKQFKGLGHISVYGDQPDEVDKEVRRESAKKHGRPVKEAYELMEEILNTLDEDVHAAIDKYAHEIKQPRLHRDAIQNYVGELVYNAKRNLPDDKKNLMSATNDEMNKIEGKRSSTKNKRGERKTDAKIAWKKGMNDYWKVKDQRKEDAANGYKNAVEKSIKRHNKKVNEAFELMEEILFELDLENKQSISPNKIKKTKKDENGEKVEVVSVADELFPYEGDAKQQFNQKILAKINDMIEGTGSLEDLIQFVRRGVGNKKVAHEGLDEAKDAKGYKENMDIANHYDHLYSKEPANSPDGSPNPVAAEWKRKYQEYFDKAMKCHYGDENKSKKVSEALSVMNDIVNTILERKNIFGHEEGNRGDLIDDVSQTVTGKTLNQHIENTANKVAKPVKTEDKIKKVGEAFELMEEILNILNESSHRRKYGDKHADSMLSVERKGTKFFKDGAKMHPGSVSDQRGKGGRDLKYNGDVESREHIDHVIKKDYQDRIKNQKNQGKSSYRDEQVARAFSGRKAGDSQEAHKVPIDIRAKQYKAEKRINKKIESANKILNKNEAFDLMEQILMETSYERKMELLRKREENADQANVNAFKDLIRGYVVGAIPEEKAKAEQDFAKSQAKNLEAQGKLNKARRLVQNIGKKKVNEALDLMEEIINEVSSKRWAQAAQNSVYTRRNNVAGSKASYETAMQLGADAPSPEEAHKEVAKREHKYGRDLARYQHAATVAKLAPKGDTPAVKAAQEVEKYNKKHSLDDNNPYKYASRYHN